MEKETKKFINDLNNRLMYGLKCLIYRTDDMGVGWRLAKYNGMCIIDEKYYEFYFDDLLSIDSINKIKPYLFPFDSITDDQLQDFYYRFIENELDFEDFKEYWKNYKNKLLASISDTKEVMEWFYERHIDINGLINKGLAIDATDKDIY